MSFELPDPHRDEDSVGPLFTPSCSPDQSTAANAPEDALVIAEVLLRIKNAVGDMPRRADGCVNGHDLWLALDEAFTTAEREAHGV